MLDPLFQLSHIYLSTNNYPYRRHVLASKQFLSHRLSILVGSRGVGKTTIIVQKLMEYSHGNLLSHDILYVPSDHFLITQMSLYQIAEQFVQHGGKVIAFDEIHKYANWSQELKNIYEAFPQLQIWVSGSSLLELHKGSHDLARRALVYDLAGISFREYLALTLSIDIEPVAWDALLSNHEAISRDILHRLAQIEQEILPCFKTYLTRGYCPYFLEMKDEPSYLLTLEQNIIATIETDIPALYPTLTGQSLRKIKQILSFLSANVPFKPNYKKLQAIVDVADSRTLKTYLKYLEDACLIRQVKSAGCKFQVLEQAEKLYLNNTNQYFALSNAPDMGTVRELFFISAIPEHIEITAPKVGDFLVNHAALFEVSGRKKDFSQIRDAKQAYLACDDLEVGFGQRIPLWLFGFLY